MGGGGLGWSAGPQHGGAWGIPYPQHQHGTHQQITQPHIIPTEGAISSANSWWPQREGAGRGAIQVMGAGGGGHDGNTNIGSTSNTACDFPQSSLQHSTGNVTGPVAGVELSTASPTSSDSAPQDAEPSKGAGTEAAAPTAPTAALAEPKVKNVYTGPNDANNSEAGKVEVPADMEMSPPLKGQVRNKPCSIVCVLCLLMDFATSGTKSHHAYASSRE